MPQGNANLVLLSGQMSLSHSMDVIANNIANSGTAGYKREAVEFESYLGKGKNADGKPQHFVFDRQSYRDTSQGPITATGNPFDFAIQGHGYFQVQNADGSTGYTRGGNFHLDPDGNIVTEGGQQLQAAGGGPIIVPVTATEFNISGDGYVTARVDDGTTLAQLGQVGLFKFDDEQQMQAQGEGIYTTTQQAQPATDASIKQGSIENSNVEPVTEITEMIKIMRSYEQMANMISNENQRQNDSVQRLSKVST